jgi:SAM-dependent methyltransferase
MKEAMASPVLRDIERYYTARVRKFGASALGVDWNSPMSQRLRFVQLLKGVDWEAETLSLHDLGCGYGALLEHLSERHPNAKVRYIGTDLSAEMIRVAQRRWIEAGHATFALARAHYPPADYTIASGIFNVCLGCPLDEWERCIASTLDRMRTNSSRGYAINFMAPSELEKRPNAVGQLYAVVPERWLAYCRNQLGCNVRLISDYGLNEFTLLAEVPSRN